MADGSGNDWDTAHLLRRLAALADRNRQEGQGLESDGLGGGNGGWDGCGG